MTDSIQLANPQAFTTVKYTTKDGENVTATKKDGIVTINGDKNGTRQMPLDDFMKKELVENVKEMKTEVVQAKTNTINPLTKTEAPVVGAKLDVTV